VEESKEDRLRHLRRQAETAGRVDGEGVRPAGSPLPAELDGQPRGYYGLPLLKAPVWTWEVPAYFFVGGAAGAAAVVGAAARLSGADAALVRDARWIAATGAALSAPLLISDLGRPERFLNMLRVFKVQSPMSVGVWTLVAFSQAASAAAFADLVHRTTHGRVPARTIGNAAEMVSAATGLVLSTYTGVLLGATAVPVWSRNAHLLPVHFGASSVGAAVSLLELMGHRDRALHRLALGAAAVETALGLVFEPADQGAGTRPSSQLSRAGSALTGPVPLALRLLAHRSRTARTLAAVSAVAGSLLNRIAWLEAGRASTKGPANEL
jgi:formate-dependent nitrite reductase membrane component NrfD